MTAPLQSTPSLPAVSKTRGDTRPLHPVGFFSQRWVQNVLPLATSLALHAGIILVGIVLFKAVAAVTNPNKDQITIPENKGIEPSIMPGGIAHPGLNNDPTRDALQNTTKESEEIGFAAHEISNTVSTGETSPFEGPKTTENGTTGSAFMPGSDGKGAPWGMPGGGSGTLPKHDLVGLSGSGRKVIYLCDASGSMLGVFGALKEQLKLSIAPMTVQDDQLFNVIFFSDDNVFPLFKTGMQLATESNKKLATEFIDNAVSTGGTQPLPAIRFAMAEKPDLVYVLTDGFDQISNFDDVINAFKSGNRDGKMHINCIFLQADDDPKLVEVLKKIAADGHGDFKKILKSDM